MGVIVKKGGYGYNIRFTVTDAAGTAVDITDYTLKMKIWPEYAPAALWTLTGTIHHGPSGLVDFAVTTSDFDIAGVYLGEVEMTKAGVVENGDTFQVIVKESP